MTDEHSMEMERQYKEVMQKIVAGGVLTGVHPNWQQADPLNVPVPWGRAGDTLRDWLP